MKFKNRLEEDAFHIAQRLYGNRATVEHNKPIRIENALLPAVTSFSGPPKKEIDVLAAEILKTPKIDLLVSCKEFDGTRAEPAHVQEWASVINTMSKYSGGTRYLGLILCPTGFSKGCEPWATSYNLGLIPPLKGKLLGFPYSTSLRMFERTLKAISKRVLFPHDGLFIPPEFYNFCFTITGDFEGFENATTLGKKERYFLVDSGWRSSFGEIVTTFVGKKIIEIISGIDYLGINVEGDITFKIYDDRIVFGKEGVRTSELTVIPTGHKVIPNETCSFDYIKNAVVGGTITSACDAGSYFEFGIDGKTNLGFHPPSLLTVTEFTDDVKPITVAEIAGKKRRGPKNIESRHL